MRLLEIPDNFKLNNISYIYDEQKEIEFTRVCHSSEWQDRDFSITYLK